MNSISFQLQTKQTSLVSTEGKPQNNDTIPLFSILIKISSLAEITRPTNFLIYAQ